MRVSINHHRRSNTEGGKKKGGKEGGKEGRLTHRPVVLSMQTSNHKEDSKPHPRHHGHKPVQAVEVDKPAQELNGLSQ